MKTFVSDVQFEKATSPIDETEGGITMFVSKEGHFTNGCDGGWDYNLNKLCASTEGHITNRCDGVWITVLVSCSQSLKVSSPIDVAFVGIVVIEDRLRGNLLSSL